MVKVCYREAYVTVYHGDCLDVLSTLPTESVQSVLTDPPYGLEFMGQDWDRPWAVSPSSRAGFVGRDDLRLPSHRDNRNASCRTCRGRQCGANRCTCPTPDWDRPPHPDLMDYQHWCERWARACHRVLTPGGHLVTFGGARTWHRLACAIEDAGFDIRDTIAWLYGTGFPKSLDVSKAIDKAAGVHRKVIDRGRAVRRMIPGADQSRTGSWIKDSGRVFVPTQTEPATAAARRWSGWGTALKPAFEPIIIARKPLAGRVVDTVLAYGTGALHIDACRVGTQTPSGLGRWPANVVLTHRPTCDPECAEGCPVEILDEQSGLLRSGANPRRRRVDKFRDCYSAFRGQVDCVPARGADAGGASRFFPAFHWHAKASRGERPRVDGIVHPTVKPVALMRWLARLITPADGVILDPFLGSGATAEAARAEGFHCIGVERDGRYLPLIAARLNNGDTTGSHSAADSNMMEDEQPPAAAA